MAYDPNGNGIVGAALSGRIRSPDGDHILIPLQGGGFNIQGPDGRIEPLDPDAASDTGTPARTSFSSPQQIAAGDQPGEESGADDAPDSPPKPAPKPADVGQYYLPGLGVTYLDPKFADKLSDFIIRAQNHNIDLSFISGYRDRAKQQAVRKTAKVSAENSLHSAGQAVDIDGWHQMDPAVQATIRADAAAAGLRWGGTFNDPNHFDNGLGGNRNQTIDGFTAGVAARKNQIPDD